MCTIHFTCKINSKIKYITYPDTASGCIQNKHLAGCCRVYFLYGWKSKGQKNQNSPFYSSGLHSPAAIGNPLISTVLSTELPKAWRSVSLLFITVNCCQILRLFLALLVFPSFFRKDGTQTACMCTVMVQRWIKEESNCEVCVKSCRINIFLSCSSYMQSRAKMKIDFFIHVYYYLFLFLVQFMWEQKS